MDEIITNLHLSSLTPATKTPALLAAKITLVLTISDSNLPLSTRTSFLASSITQLHFSVHDLPSDDLLAIFPSTCNLIQTQLASNKGVLIHSGIGMSCSAAVVTAYIMKVRMLGAFEAMDLVRERHGGIMPNLGFVNQLVVWEECGWELFEEVDGERRKKSAYEEWKGEAREGSGKGKLITWGCAGGVKEGKGKGKEKLIDEVCMCESDA
ncbi:hypothetical protein N7G274_000248 [Stereocaulon virgatum]|uniref:Tyrosine-protein phosphatase domain-containing protein n=1 Tax=Stereocaulon virgatum TaxID=373712 RepID=A0ABR4ARK3_9LECA